ncbi:MAG: aldehyde dehydrogenase family protein [Bacteroidia bacterium]|nr:aldehyde dehydrogenase family protein [Bacteroidia bacterium]
MKNYNIYSAGNFTTTKVSLNICNSYNNEVFATTYLAGKNELEDSIKAALSVKEELKQMPLYQRYNILFQIAEEIKGKRATLATVLSQEACKPVKYATAEIDRAAQVFQVAAEESKRNRGEYIPIDWTPAGNRKEGWLKYFPVGLIAGITPFNFPLNLAVHKIAPALAAGNPIILKPARSTPLSTLELAEIINKTSLPKGAVSILPMDRESGNQLVTDERFRLLSFTGSPQVGWKMKNDAGTKKVILELGGNAAVIITESGFSDLTIKKCLTGSFAYSGQVCIHLQRIYVHDSYFDPFVEKFIDQVKAVKYGHPLDESTDISAMIDEENAIRVEEWVSEAVSQGAKILHGGNRTNNYYEPTILTNTHHQMKVNCREIFGPVVIIEKYTDFCSAVEMVNHSKYGLQAGVFTNNLTEMNYAFDHIEAGGVMINESPSFRIDHMPYGGIKSSGLGREGIKYAMLEMMEPKLLIKDF